MSANTPALASIVLSDAQLNCLVFMAPGGRGITRDGTLCCPTDRTVVPVWSCLYWKLMLACYIIQTLLYSVNNIFELCASFFLGFLWSLSSLAKERICRRSMSRSLQPCLIVDSMQSSWQCTYMIPDIAYHLLSCCQIERRRNHFSDLPDLTVIY